MALQLRRVKCRMFLDAAALNLALLSIKKSVEPHACNVMVAL